MMYSSSWRSPSNIALIKYWGKHGLQFPRNPSLSFTLSACHTNMHVHVTPEATLAEILVLYDGKPRPSFEPKIKTFFSLINDRFTWLAGSSVVIDSYNTFPYGAGIASSASAMSALALCLMDINDQISGSIVAPETLWWNRASEVARLGSGSACRSLYPVAAVWGKIEAVEESSDSFATPWETQLSSIYKDFQDTILVVSSSEKSVSSTSGHQLMEGLPYADIRYAEAKRHIARLIKEMHRDDSFGAFISIVEAEALQLHALMLCGNPPFILMEPGTLSIIQEVWRFRKESGIPVCFTLDAGPNVHLLYPSAYKGIILDWVKLNLAQYCANGKYILDHVGLGPQKIL